MTFLIFYAHCGPLRKVKRPHKRGFVASYQRGSIHYAIQQLIPSARLHCIHQRFHTPANIHAVVQ